MIPVAVVVTAIVAWLIAEILLGRRRKLAFEKEFTPISDAEFMALCPPGTNPAIALKVRRIVSDSLGVEYERIYPSSSFANDLGAD
jgi:hypothetical protein